MKRKSAESSQGCIRLGFVGWLASSVVSIVICGTAAAQDGGSKPPDLIPLEPIGALTPLDEFYDPAQFRSEDPRRQDVVSYFKRPHDFKPAETTTVPESKAPSAPKTPVAQPQDWRRETQEAISYLDQEISAHPDRAEYYYQRAELRAQITPCPDAAAYRLLIADLNEVLRRDPNHLEALARRSYLRLEIGDDEGIADAERVLEQSPRHVLANYTRASAYYRDEDFGAALEHLGRVVNGSGKLALRVNYLRAQCLARLGRYQAAIDSLTEAMASYVCDADMYLVRARWYHEIGARDLARKDIVEYIHLRENNLESRVQADLAMLQMGEPGFVYLDADSLRRDHPKDPFPYLLRFAARYMDSCRRDRVLSRVETIADWVRAFLPLQPVPSMVRISSQALTGLGRELAFKDMEHGLDLIGRLSFPYAGGALVNACEGRVVPTCRDLILVAVRFNPRHFQFGLSFERAHHQLSFSFREAEHLEADPADQRDCSQVLEIIFLALGSCFNSGN